MSDTNSLRQVIADQLERQPSDFIGSPSLSVGYVINREINHAIQHYESTRFRWNEVREAAIATTVSGTEAYSLPADLVRLDTLKVILSATRFRLNPVPWEDIEDRARESGAQGLPQDYVIYGNMVRVWPVPNASLSMVGSYIRRFRPTSLTGSYCLLIVMGGASLSATTTASHNNRLNGWTTDGAELIRERAAAAVEIKYFHNQESRIEAGALAQAGLPFLSVLERHAFDRVALEREDIYKLVSSVPPRPAPRLTEDVKE